MLATGYALLEYVMSYIVCEGGNGGSLPKVKRRPIQSMSHTHNSAIRY